MVKKLILSLILIFLLFLNSCLFSKAREVLAITISPPFNLPTEVIINQTFNLQGEISGAQPGQFYYIKCRLGLSSSNLNEGQTYNLKTDSWLADTSAWIEMPYSEADNNNFNFSLSCRVKSGAAIGDKVVFLRACLKQADGSCTNSFQSASGLNLKALAEIIPTLTPTPLLTPNPTPTIKIVTPTPTLVIKLPTPTPKPVAIYKINEVKDNDGEILSNVKVYVDDVYLHHYAPEVITFCDNCWCDNYVSCGFGQHKIKLEKTGYDYWQEEKTINSKDSYEVNPVMIFSTGNLSLTPTPTPTTVIIKPTASLTIAPGLKSTSSSFLKTAYEEASQSGEILGQEIEATSAFYPLEATDKEASDSSNNFGKNRFWPKFFFGSALAFLFFASFWVWYNLRTRD